MRVVVVSEKVFGEILNQGLPHKDVTKEIEEIVEMLGSGHVDAVGAVGVAIQLSRLLKECEYADKMSNDR